MKTRLLILAALVVTAGCQVGPTNEQISLYFDRGRRACQQDLDWRERDVIERERALLLRGCTVTGDQIISWSRSRRHSAPLPTLFWTDSWTATQIAHGRRP